ncbi:hypothetical protein [Sphingosinicella sp. BN140058]|uniref:hypothetical protein n=1 Tax=Sphingosinicella sp. BN140058 TaxID=1892855 RepID=UPI0013EAF4A0|nr:hypothetical protein [Sphingosinicella sp. BN140058]
MIGVRRTMIAIAAGVGAATLTFVNLPTRAHSATPPEARQADAGSQQSFNPIAILISGR